MRKGSYKNILYFITAVIIITLAIQVYWNYKNYKTGKQQLINEVQISLDNAVDEYFTELAKENAVFIMPNNMMTKAAKQMHHMQKNIVASTNFKHLDSFKLNENTNISIVKDSTTQGIHIIRSPNLSRTEANQKVMDIMLCLEKGQIKKHNSDSINEVFSNLATKAIVSITQDSLKLTTINSYLQRELSRKNINVDYGLRFINPFGVREEIGGKAIKSAVLHTKSKSSFLPRLSSLELFFTNEKLTIFRKNLLGILLSFTLVGAVIGCLLFLLRIIYHQKQLAELKNDLISNITHEFKTPIATISAALESIQSFNTTNDPEKTKKYVEISTDHLSKLNTMVEKILETATLDSEELELDFEEIDLVQMIDSIIKKHQGNSSNKKITLDHSQENIWKKVDPFHFENALNNIIDNAIKYGGDIIKVVIKGQRSGVIIEIIDNGVSLNKTHRERIFDKFYRVPKGNAHDIKGFGIGLFYTKTIIEKHKATIQLILEQGQTNFKINLPNG
ncbi:cell wall metabolism sensor histidine kinase WalK [Aquimarina sp. AU474]|uniref:sensor histidine kinase n=1 Tax=Aquimarina sp. AU474 TaxID=2108529 RepID=UPI000D69854A|nr:HAMP domain-containing sensor histidine kinase [Aquimarina sp. AU474]